MFRWLALAIFICVLATSAYFRARARSRSETIARTRESGPLIALRAVVAVLLFFPVIAYAAFPQWMNWASFDLPTWVRWIGVVLGLMTIPAAAWVLRSLGQNVSETVLTKQAHQLVMTGPYRWVRHPLYTTGLTLFFGFGLILASWFVLFMASVAAILILLVVIPTEERALLEKFGARYQQFMSTTGRLFPR